METTIKTYVRRQYSRDDLGVLDYVDHCRWSIDGLPRWVGECNAPLTWNDEFVGEGEDLPTMDFVASLLAPHKAAIPDGCNHASVQSHTVDTADLPPMMAESMAAIAAGGHIQQ